MKSLAIIPARGGSKRIPRKNIKPFLGKPIISYSIETALSSGLFDEVMVSTDDEEIAEVAKKHGAKVPFLRSKENSDDFATTADVLAEVINKYDYEFQNACCIYPTAPLITVDILREARDTLIKNNFDSAFPVVKFSYPIQRSLLEDNDRIKMVWPEFLNSRSQDLDPRFHDAGQFYWFNVQKFLLNRAIFTENAGFVLLNELLVQDIDSETDWLLAELKYRILNKVE